MSLKETLGNSDWMIENESALKEMLPKTWTHVGNLNLLQIGFSLKLLGVDWRGNDDVPRIMIFLEEIGIMSRDNFLVKANPLPMLSSIKD
ncbi:MAG: hypothetical protein OEY89_11320 [Gammaproteobacteria bacterium]|nr:hypothetical protein [Gammaproteobacteria bacterium]